MGMSFDELLAEAENEVKEEGLSFRAKDGTEVVLRPLLLLEPQEMKNVLALMSRMQGATKKAKKNPQDDDVNALTSQLEAVDAILLAVSDKKDPMRESLEALPHKQHFRIFEEWMKATDAPEASRSAS